MNDPIEKRVYDLQTKLEVMIFVLLVQSVLLGALTVTALIKFF
tara:strand:+ start:4681 stop:4809 length:129 start_codon:yes stop_codon:yes gene_type:complete